MSSLVIITLLTSLFLFIYYRLSLKDKLSFFYKRFIRVLVLEDIFI